jgi:hypothetical protein
MPGLQQPALPWRNTRSCRRAKRNFLGWIERGRRQGEAPLRPAGAAANS